HCEKSLHPRQRTRWGRRRHPAPVLVSTATFEGSRPDPPVYIGGGRPWGVTMIRVLGVDDHPLMMAGVAGAIDAQPDMKMIGVASDGAAGLQLFRELQPDITLMDLLMPGMCGIDAISAIRADFPTARIIVLTTSAGD